MAGTVTDKSITVSAGGEDVGAATALGAAVGFELIGTSIAALAADDVVLTTAEGTDDSDEAAIVKAAVLASKGGTCTLT